MRIKCVRLSYLHACTTSMFAFLSVGACMGTRLGETQTLLAYIALYLCQVQTTPRLCLAHQLLSSPLHADSGESARNKVNHITNSSRYIIYIYIYPCLIFQPSLVLTTQCDSSFGGVLAIVRLLVLLQWITHFSCNVCTS